jgi:hypothetical protein
MVSELTALGATLRPLASARAGLDLAPSIHDRIAGSRSGGRARARHKRRRQWWLLPAGFAAALSLSAGVYLGALLAGGMGVRASQPAVMVMFDAVPPGGVCPGVRSCYPRGR